MSFIGYGEDGFGIIYGGFDDGGSNAPIPIEEGATILFDPDAPNFLVKVKLRTPGAKPDPATQMVGPLVEFMSHFWALFETSGVTLADIAGNNPGTIHAVHGAIAFGAAEFGGGIVGTGLAAPDDITITPVVLRGAYSFEYLVNDGAGWQHIVITNDPNDGNIVYTNGVGATPTPYVTTPFTVNGLLTLGGAVPANRTVDFVRTWDRALDVGEVSALQADPYTMFGVNAALLDEIRTIVNFMKPIRSQWRFVYL